MTTGPNQSVRELRRILGQTQAEWAVMVVPAGSVSGLIRELAELVPPES